MHDALIKLNESIASGEPLNVPFATPTSGGVLFFNTPSDVRAGRLSNLRHWAQQLRHLGAAMPSVMDSPDLISIVWERGDLSEKDSEWFSAIIFGTEGWGGAA